MATAARAFRSTYYTKLAGADIPAYKLPLYLIVRVDQKNGAEEFVSIAEGDEDAAQNVSMNSTPFLTGNGRWLYEARDLRLSSVRTTGHKLEQADADRLFPRNPDGSPVAFNAEVDPVASISSAATAATPNDDESDDDVSDLWGPRPQGVLGEVIDEFWKWLETVSEHANGGNKAAVAAEHYLQVTDADFETASRVESAAPALRAGLSLSQLGATSASGIDAAQTKKPTFPQAFEGPEGPQQVFRVGDTRLELVPPQLVERPKAGPIPTDFFDNLRHYNAENRPRKRSRSFSPFLGESRYFDETRSRQTGKYRFAKTSIMVRVMGIPFMNAVIALGRFSNSRIRSRKM